MCFQINSRDHVQLYLFLGVIWLSKDVFLSHGVQGLATGTEQCCTASSVGSEATHTTSCVPSASAPLPVHAGETWFHWLENKRKWRKRAAAMPCDLQTVFLCVAVAAAALTGCGVCGLCRHTQVSHADMCVNQSSRTRKYHYISHCISLSLPFSCLSPGFSLTGLTFVWRSVCGLWAQAADQRGLVQP